MVSDKINQNTSSALEYLKDYISNISPYIDTFFSEQKRKAAKICDISELLIEKYHNFMGGKHLRGGLTKLGYEIISGDKSNNEDIMRASLVVEIIHAFLLMHDDFMDQDSIRRGKPTIHVQYEKLFREKYKTGTRDKKLYAGSMAVLMGDLAPFFSNLIINNTKFPDNIKLKFLCTLSDILIKTIYGQAMDISCEQDEIPNESNVMAIHKYKTAYYTIIGPLQYGAVLAGIDEKDKRFEAIEKFGQAAGLAFQLKDDELGMLSSQEKLGKPIYSDLRQGKNTLLFAKAFEKANKTQYDFLRRVFGNKNATIEDMEKVNDTLVKTGSIDYSAKLVDELIWDVKRYIPEVTKDRYYQAILESFLDYIINREK